MFQQKNVYRAAAQALLVIYGFQVETLALVASVRPAPRAARPVSLTEPASSVAPSSGQRAADAASPASVKAVERPHVAPVAVASSTESCAAALTSHAAPAISVAVSQLWPANHSLIDVGLAVAATAPCSGQVAMRVEVWSDEPDESPAGDGSTVGDARFSDTELYLRSERRGDADGRVYLAIAKATLPGGVTGAACETVTVPHGRSRAALTSVQRQADEAEASCDASGQPPVDFVKLAESWVAAPNTAPVVDAGGDQAVEFPNPATLRGTARDDGFPNGVLTHAWTLVSGPGEAAFAPSDQLETAVTFSEPGTYTLRLTVSDGALSGSDEVDVIVADLPANTPPVVTAGDDQTVVLPSTSVLQATVTDDGLPSGVVTSLWTSLPADGVQFDDATSTSTGVSFAAPGHYVLTLTATDGQFAASDSLDVTVSAEPVPELSVEPAATVEGHEGISGATVRMRLSKPWPQPVEADFTTADGTASVGCDYHPRYGHVTFEPGQTVLDVLVPVVGDALAEQHETVLVRVGNVTGATLVSEQTALTITNDDADSNRAPAPVASRFPANGATGVGTDVTLVWSGADPDEGDVVAYDVYLGTSPGTTGQRWSTSCTVASGPSTSAAAPHGYDATLDRLFVVPTQGSDVWWLDNATGAAGEPVWSSATVGDGPDGLHHAASAYDVDRNRLIVFGGCTGDCSSGTDDTWVLDGANGSTPPTWSRLDTGARPQARFGSTASYDAATGSFIVFGGASTPGSTLDDVWVLNVAAATWTLLQPQGAGPGPRVGMSAAYDVRTNRLIVFGGSDGDRAHADTWVLTHANGTGGVPEWLEIPVEGQRPPARHGALPAYDSLSGRLLVFGGTTAGVVENVNFVFADAWMLLGADGTRGPATWVRVDAAPGTTPVARFDAVGGYSPQLNQWIVFGGSNNKIGPPSDLWTLSSAVGDLPLVAANQLEADHPAMGLDDRETYLWKVVAKDGHGAWRGSEVWSFSPNAVPVVDAGPDTGVTLPTAATLTGTVLDDGRPTGSVLSFEWALVSGPDAVHFGDHSALVTVAHFDSPGTYVLRLTASDTLATAADEVMITVAAENQPPLVDAGPDQHIAAPTTTLTGLVSDDGLPVGSQLTVGWEAVAGPGLVAFGSAQSVSTTAAFSASGTYVLRLTASDGEITSSDDIVIVLDPLPPDCVVSGIDVSGIVSDGQTLTISGTVSAQIANVGGSPAVGPFSVAFFEDRNGNGTFEPGADFLLGSASSATLGQGASATITAAVSGTVLFRGSPVHAFVDSGQAVPELNEANNYASSVSPGPDLIPSFVRKTEDGTTVSLTARIGNAGGLPVGPDVPVSFYDGDPVAAGRLLGTVFSTGTLEPGGFQDVTLILAAGAVARPVWVVADDLGTLQGTVTESDETNNAHDSGVCIGDAPAPPDGYTLVAEHTLDISILQGAYYDPHRNEVAVFDYYTGKGRVLRPDGTPVRNLTVPPTAFGSLDGATYDSRQRRALLITQSCVVTEADPVTMATLAVKDIRGFGMSVCQGIAVGQDDNVYVASYGTNDLIALDRAFTRVVRRISASSIGVSGIDGVAVVPGSQDRLTAVSSQNGRAVIISLTGSVLAGPALVGQAPFTAPNLSGYTVPDAITGLSVNGHMWICQGYGNRCAVFAPTGDYVNSCACAWDYSTCGNEAPAVDAGLDQTISLPTDTVSLDGTVTDDGLPVGGIVTFQWSKLVGPGDVTFANSAAADTTATISGPGTFVLRLTASDGELTNVADVTVTVLPLNTAPADLVPTLVDAVNLSWSPDGTSVSGTLTIVVANTGAGPAGSSRLTAFEDRNNNGTFEAPEDAVVGEVQVPAIAPGATVEVPVDVHGEVWFRGNLIHVLVDSSFDVAETDEGNNYASTEPECVAPAPQPFAPALKWAWTDSGVAPQYNQVVMTPAVADIDGDNVPDVVFTTYYHPSGFMVEGVLRAVSGADGRELFAVTDVDKRVNPLTQVALGDLDGDGRPEIVAVSRSQQLIAFRGDGSLYWHGVGTETSWQHGAPVLADLDADGRPEIVLGRQVFDADGRVRWTGTGAAGAGRFSAVADIDMDGSPEVLAGNTVYRADGSIAWTNSTVPSASFVAVANFDADTYPEIVVVGGGRIWLLQHDGTVAWGPITIVGGGGGPPVIADMDGDGRPEIGIAGASRYTVLDGDGLLKWSRVIRDTSSAVTGSSVFDFEGDGAAEVVYADELSLRVYRGADGAVIWETPLGSATAHENPVIVDVDGNGSAEIVVAANLYFGGLHHGIYVYGSPTWVATRRIWNQHAYHITNVADDASIPAVAPHSWTQYNSYRQNRLTSGCEFARPDLTASYLRREQVETGSTRLTVRVGNAGSAPVPAGVRVTFHDGPPESLRLVGAAVTAGRLEPGSFEDVVLTLAEAVVARPLWVVADDPSAHIEPDEANNAYETSLYLTATPNAAPVVDAGPDRVIRLPHDTVALDATATDDGQPVGVLTYSWSVIAGGEAVFATPAEEDTLVTFIAPGTYTLQLRVSDRDKFAIDTVTVVVQPPNQAPTVDAGPDQDVATRTTSVAAVGIDDGIHEALTYRWSTTALGVTFGTAAAATTSVTFAADGTFTLRVDVTDGEKTAFDTVDVRVAIRNAAPVVNAGSDVTMTLPTQVAVLSGSATDDGSPEPSTISYRWEAIGASATAVTLGSPTALQTTATFAEVGNYVLRLHVSDGVLTGSDDLQVDVIPGATPATKPVAELLTPAHGAGLIGPTDVTGVARSESMLGWRLEHRRQGDAAWTTFARGTTEVASGVLGSLDPTLLLNGLYQVRLTVTDTGGQIARDIVDVVIKENRKVGHFSVAFTDLEVPVAGMPIRVTRTYDSRDKAVGDFGHGWRLDVSNVRLAESGLVATAYQGAVNPGWFPSYCLQAGLLPLVTVTLPDGKVLEYEAVLTPSCQQFIPPDATRVSYRPRAGSYGTLKPAGNDIAYVAASWPGPVQLFDETFDLFDPEQYVLTLPDGRTLLVDQAKGLQTLTDLNGNRLTYTANGIHHSAGKSITFTRDALGRITRVADPDPTTPDLVYGYDAAGDLVAATDREEETTSFAYDLDFPHHLASITDPLGRTPIRNEYYDDGRIKSHTDAFGKTILYEHDLTGRQELVTDRNGKLRVLHYEERGNVTKEIGPDGSHVDRTYDARNNRLTETEPYDPATIPEPRKTTWTYDAADNVTSVTNPKNEKTEFTYNARRQVLTSKDARGKVTENVYDPKGNLTSTKDALGNISTYVYDGQGNVTSQTVTVDGVTQTTGYDYDTAGNLTTETDAAGHETIHTYDASGNRRTQTTTRTRADGTVQTLVTTHEYDNSGRLKKTTDPDGSFTRTVYDALGRATESYDKLGRKTTSDYDDMGRLVKTTYPDTTFDASTYDPEGRRLTSTDRAGRTTTYDYDDAGRLKKTIYPDETFTETVYDDAGRVTQTIDARLKSTFFGYDDAGRRTSVRNALGHETLFGYDPNGNQTTVRDARQKITTSEYDDLNRRTKTIYPDLTFTETTYDTLGRRVAERDQAGKVTQFRYDALGRLSKVIDANLKETVYRYDELGNRTSQTDANGRTTRFEYDAFGRETKRCLPDDACETKTYDVAGRLETRTDFRGWITTYTYEPNTDRLASRTHHDGEVVSFTYYPTGRRQTMTDPTGTTSYDYDVRDRLTKITVPSGDTVEYTWDESGNRLTLKTTVKGVATTTTFSYDDLSRLDVVTDWLGGVNDHEYDENGNRQSLRHFNGVTTTYGFNDLNRLTSLTSVSSLGQTVQGYAFELGPSGNRRKITEMDGTVRDYGYDDLYRLTSEAVSRAGILDYEKSFAYDAVGNRRSQATTRGPAATATSPNALAIDYTYDTRDRLTLEQVLADGAAGIVYTYDANGNTTGKLGEATYTWDAQDRLRRVEKVDGTVVEHVYDGDGVRVKTTTTPAGGTANVVNYLVDTSRSLSHVVAEINAAGDATVYYVRSDDELIGIIRPDGAGGWTRKAVHADGIGSIRKLTDAAGAVTDRYEYTAFGELLSHVGSDPQPYAFAGEPLDPNSGFQYHRARWMDPRIGRFASTDGFSGRSRDPKSLHKYMYAGGDPLEHYDPSGHETLASFMTGFSITAVLVRAGIGATLGTADAALRGYPLRQGAALGAAGGVLGPLVPLKIGIGFMLYGVGEALYAGDYDAAFFRAATGGFGFALQTRGFTSFRQFKDFWGTAGSGRAWHHIVEQTPGNLGKFGNEALHNPSNLVPLAHGAGTVHAKISGFYSSRQPAITGSPTLTVRQWLASKPYGDQFRFGLEAMQRFGAGSSSMNVFGPSASWTWPAALEAFEEATGFGQEDEPE